MQTIAYQQVKDLQERNAATLINVLPAEYFEKTHIPGSINVPVESSDFAEQVKKVIGGKNEPVVLYCASYSCDKSKRAALKLDQAGFTNVMCYEGGAKEWQEKASSRSAA
jgi:rhodanese-related sulfurtransferase